MTDVDKFFIGIIVVVFLLAALRAAFLRERDQLPERSSSRRANQRPQQSKRRNELPKDAWDGGIYEGSQIRRVSAALDIEYVDTSGQKTNRVVNVIKMDNELYGGVMYGTCQLRGEHRTFRLDRIRRCIDTETGELVEDVKDHLNAVYNAAPERLMERLYEDYKDVARVLLFVAKADGQYRKEEKAVVAEYLQELLGDDRIDVDLVNASAGDLDVPSLAAFKQALGRIIRAGDVNPETLRECCHSIVRTQKTVHPSEQDALDYIDKKVAASRA